MLVYHVALYKFYRGLLVPTFVLKNREERKRKEHYHLFGSIVTHLLELENKMVLFVLSFIAVL